MSPKLVPQVFAITSRLIEDETGLHYGLEDSELLADRLAARAGELGLDSLLDYYYFLRYDERGNEELQRLVETLVVHETYLFRENESLSVLIRSIVPAMLRTKARLRLWSAACATGEEPYTLALMLSEDGLLDRVDVLATDISHRALVKARGGAYSGRSLRALPDAVRRSPWLEEHSGGVRVVEALRARIDWRRLNLMDGGAIATLGLFDVVLCRNALIYFSDATVARVAASLFEAIRPGGLLLVGASESLLRFGTLFDCEEHGGSFFYRRMP